MNEKEVSAFALEFAKKNKKELANKLTNRVLFKVERYPVSVFMAGSPGAGKTEFSKKLIAIFEKQERQVVRIDGDEIRSEIPGYTGDNSYLFQGAVSLVVEKIHDNVLKRRQNFILDGTFSKYEKAVQNIQRSLQKDRLVFIFYIYQRPEIAWIFTKAREKSEGRNIPKSVFIEEFLNSREVVCQIRKKFGNKVVVVLVKKDFKKNTVEHIEIEQNGRDIDSYLDRIYTKNELQNII